MREIRWYNVVIKSSRVDISSQKPCTAAGAYVGGAGGGWAVSRDGGDSGEITTQFTLLHSPPPTPRLTTILICLEIPVVSLPPLSTSHTTKLAQLTKWPASSSVVCLSSPPGLRTIHLMERWWGAAHMGSGVTPAHKTLPVPCIASMVHTADLLHCTQTTSAPGTVLIDHTDCGTASVSDMKNSGCDGSGGQQPVSSVITSDELFLSPHQRTICSE